jgi:hypothetical protein
MKKYSQVLWPRDLAARWAVSPVTLWRHERARNIPSRDFRVGDRTGWTLKAVERYENSVRKSEAISGVFGDF